MSVQALSAVLENSQSRLGARLVLIAIANHANERGENAFPNLETLAGEAHLSVRQVIRAVQELEELGELVVTRASNKPNLYTIHLASLRGDKKSRDVRDISKNLSLTTRSLGSYGSRDISGPDLSPGDNLSPQTDCTFCGEPVEVAGYCPAGCEVAS